MLATCVESKHRDGKAAVKHGVRSCELCNWKKPLALEAVSAAYAELGEFKKAMEILQKAMDVSPESEKVLLAEMMDCFKVNKPFHLVPLPIQQSGNDPNQELK